MVGDGVYELWVKKNIESNSWGTMMYKKDDDDLLSLERENRYYYVLIEKVFFSIKSSKKYLWENYVTNAREVKTWSRKKTIRTSCSRHFISTLILISFYAKAQVWFSLNGKCKWKMNFQFPKKNRLLPSKIYFQFLRHIFIKMGNFSFA